MEWPAMEPGFGAGLCRLTASLPKLLPAHTSSTCPAPALPKPDGRVPLHVAICPRCNIHCAATSLSFLPFNLEVNIRCPVCHKPSVSRHWKCTCELSWHLCCRHVPIAPARKTSRVTRSPCSAKRPADKPPGEILDDELRRESKHARKEESVLDDPPVIELGSSSAPPPIRPGMLPPSLRARFPHVCM